MAERPCLRALAGLATAALALAGCSFAPPYQPPATTPVTTFKETGPFTTATPADLLARGPWWTLFQDPVLTGLENQLDTDNPTLAGALARSEQAQAFLLQAEAGLGFRAGVTGSTTGNRQSDDRPLRGNGQPNEYQANSLVGGISYELDLWGRVRNAVAAGRAEAEASKADVAAAKLSLQAQLADVYVQLRGTDDELRLLNDTVRAYAQAYDLTNKRHAGGIASGLDLGRSETQLADARAQISDLAARRALLEHAVASLVGEPASNFTLPAAAAQLVLPSIPTGLPSTLLQRRPDVAAAERRVAEANAAIGVARAAFYPAITLDGSLGFQSTERTFFFDPGNILWSLGPSAALTVFDSGRRHAVERAAFAARDVAAADYRARVLGAFQDTEDALATLNHLGAETQDQAEAVNAAGRTERLSFLRYQGGATTLLDVTVAQTAALQARRQALALNTRRLEAAVRLIRAVGGGWSA